MRVHLNSAIMITSFFSLEPIDDPGTRRGVACASMRTNGGRVIYYPSSAQTDLVVHVENACKYPLHRPPSRFSKGFQSAWPSGATLRRNMNPETTSMFAWTGPLPRCTSRAP
jgi:hypothetical protein